MMEGEEGVRLDQYIGEKSGGVRTRSEVQGDMRRGGVEVNGEVKKKSYKVQKGDIVRYRAREEEGLWVLRMDRGVDFEIIYEDEWLLVINKPRGLVVHPVGGHGHRTLVHGLVDRLGKYEPFGRNLRPGVVHRLDKETSGVMMIAKDPVVEGVLKEEFKRRRVKKYYECLVKGKVLRGEGWGEYSDRIVRSEKDRKKYRISKDEEKGKSALTKYKVRDYYIARGKVYTLIEVELVTGRTHQIRVHCAGAGHAVVGDEIYGRCRGGYEKRYEKRGLALCAKRLIFKHPVYGRRMDFEVGLPEHFEEIKKELVEL